MLKEAKGTLMEGWIRDMFIENGRIKMMQVGTNNENTMVDNLLQQINGGELRTQVVKWQNVCFNVHLAVKEIVFARSVDLIDKNSYMKMLRTISSKLCSLSVCVLTWLVSYKAAIPKATLDMDAYTRDYVNLMDNEASEVFINEMPHKDERVNLMKIILTRIQEQVGLKPRALQEPKLAKAFECTPNAPLRENLLRVWAHLTKQGYLDNDSVRELVELYKTGGALWFTTCLVEELMTIIYQDEIDRAVQLVVALFHLDVEQCTLALLLHVVPSYLHTKEKKPKLADPHGSALASVLVSCLYADFVPTQLLGARKTGGKRPIDSRSSSSDYIPSVKM